VVPEVVTRSGFRRPDRLVRVGCRVPRSEQVDLQRDEDARAALQLRHEGQPLLAEGGQQVVPAELPAAGFEGESDQGDATPVGPLAYLRAPGQVVPARAELDRPLRHDGHGVRRRDVRDAPELAHHFDVDAYSHGAMFGPASLLASYAPMAPERCRALFEAGVRRDTAELSRLQHEVVALSAELWALPGAGPHIDGAYDKLLLHIGLQPGFPLRLLSPYQGFTEADAARCRSFMEARYPAWLPG